MFETVKADLSRFADPSVSHGEAAPLTGRGLARVLRQQGSWAVIEYRFRQWARSRINNPIVKVLTFVTSKMVESMTGISISGHAQFGPGLYIGHFGGIVIGPGVRVGPDCNLSQGVTIGINGRGESRGTPTIGDGVYIGPGAKVFGKIVVGDRVVVGANAVVNKSVEPDMIAVGVPARARPRSH